MLYIKAIISGWGSLSSGGAYPTKLKRANVTIWSNYGGLRSYCSNIIQDKESQFWCQQYRRSRATFPASVDGSVDACQVWNKTDFSEETYQYHISGGLWGPTSLAKWRPL